MISQTNTGIVEAVTRRVRAYPHWDRTRSGRGRWAGLPDPARPRGGYSDLVLVHDVHARVLRLARGLHARHAGCDHSTHPVGGRGLVALLAIMHSMHPMAHAHPMSRCPESAPHPSRDFSHPAGIGRECPAGVTGTIYGLCEYRMAVSSWGLNDDVMRFSDTNAKFVHRDQIDVLSVRRPRSFSSRNTRQRWSSPHY